MKHQAVSITVYGANKVCASCVNAPSSLDTYEWLQAAILRKFNDSVKFLYIDINIPTKEQKHQNFVQRIIEEDLFYPVILVDDDIVAEGIPRLKPIIQALELKGLK
ncbi:YuzD family protein [Aquibacillus rhizosphaerae]|uniref:YuzD family protein n=1 Tax=Aquibacillus rhizosphaerae TaxID=3051431 RepID=A0ABT7L988_9BACI|nr:YuzD family protein [Aquibacillus sp. LR5S19]MDL4841939.1 YuzD family protein [Aquibacillus sp. LR5S19]